MGSMSNQESIKTLKSESCYECSFGCDSPINCINTHCAVAESVKLAIEALEQLEKEKWIPVSERVPTVEEIKEARVKLFDDSFGYIAGEFTVTIKGAEVSTTLYFDGKEWFDEGTGEVYTVVAWRKMPEAFKEAGGTDGKDN